MAGETASGTQQGFDEVLGALKQVVERLESGQLSLESALAAFEQGVKLAQTGSQILDDAERRVELLTHKDGATSVQPFEAQHDPT